MDPLQQALQKSSRERAERLRKLLELLAGDARFKELRAEIQQQLSVLERDLRGVRESLPQTVRDILGSSAFFERISELIRDHLASHEKRQPHPTPMELSRLIVETVREAFADAHRMSPEEVAKLARVQAESTVQKLVASQLWSTEIARIAQGEAEKVSAEHARKIEQEIAKVRWGKESASLLEAPEAKAAVEGIVRRTIESAGGAPAAPAGAKGAGEAFADWLATDAGRAALSRAVRDASEEAVRREPAASPQEVLKAALSAAEGAVAGLRKELSDGISQEGSAREAADKAVVAALESLRQGLEEAKARPAGVAAPEVRAIAAAEAAKAAKGIKVLTGDEARAIAAEEAQKAAGALPKSPTADEVRESAKESAEALRGPLLAAAEAAARGAVEAAFSPEKLRAAVGPMVAEAVAAQLSGIAARIEERIAKAVDPDRLEQAVAKRVEEEVARQAGAAAPDAAALASAAEEAARKVIKGELRPVKEALLQALPVEIQNAVSGLLERQAPEMESRILGSPQFVETVQRMVEEEVLRSRPSAPEPKEPASAERKDEPDRGTIREHFLALKERGRWKRPGGAK